MRKILFVAALISSAFLAQAQQRITSSTGTTTAPTSNVSPQPNKVANCGSDTQAAYSLNLGDQSTAINPACRTAATQTPIACQDQGVSWGPGNICAGNASGTAHGTNRSVINVTNKYTGNATFQCTNGVFAVTGNPSCNYVPDNCTVQNVNWGTDNCTGSASSTNHGSTRTVSNTANNRTGSATYQCNDGVLTLQSQTCDRTDKPCTPATRGWSQSGFNCSGNVPSLTHNAQATVQNNVAGFNGSASFRCSNTVLSSTGTPSCSQVTCGAGPISWGAGCQASAPSRTFNQTTGTLGNTRSGFTGSADFSCTSSGYTMVSGDCRALNPCASGRADWGNGCTANYPQLAHGATQTFSTSGSNTTGTVQLQCVDGLITASNASCARTDTPCNNSTIGWGGSCSGATGNIAHGSTATVFNNVGGFTGNVSASCSNGVVSQSGASCTQTCAATTLNWGASCSASVGQSINGQSQSLANATGGYTGSATYICSNGTYQQQSGASCAEAPCAAGTKAWGPGNACTASFPGISSGSASTQNNTASGFSGSASFSCTRGVYSYSSGSCVSATNACSAQRLNWGAACSAQIAGVSHNTSSSGTNDTANYSGSATYTCNNGTFQLGANNCAVVAPSVTINASNSNITQGQSTSISWSSAGVSSCTASSAWSGAQPTSGSATVTPPSAGSYSYTLTCSGPGGSRTATATVNVASAEPPCTLDTSTYVWGGSCRVDELNTFDQELDCCATSVLCAEQFSNPAAKCSPSGRKFVLKPGLSYGVIDRNAQEGNITTNTRTSNRNGYRTLSCQNNQIVLDGANGFYGAQNTCQASGSP